MAANNNKANLAVARAKRNLQVLSKVQALHNYYDQWNNNQHVNYEMENERMNRSNVENETMHKASLAVARAAEIAKRERSTFAEGTKTLVKIVEGPKWKAPFAGLQMAHHFRQQVKDHDNSPFHVMLVWAIIVDIADATWIIGFLLKLPLFYFLFGRGTWKARIAARVIRRIVIMMIADLIPFVSWIPFSTISVLYAWKKSAEEARKARKGLKEIKSDSKEYEKELKNGENDFEKEITGDQLDYDEIYAEAA